MLARINVDRFFFRRQQIEEQGRESRVIQSACDKLITRTMPAAPAPVNKKHQCLRLIGNRQIADDEIEDLDRDAGFLQKPFTPSELTAKIAEVLGS